jgi:purine-binding chemotaxis protein CheW
MDRADPLVVFALDRQRFALPLALVARVVRAVEVTPLPNAPEIVSGVIDVQGEVIPVLDVRSRLGLPPRAIGLADQLLIAHTQDRSVALLVDQVQGLAESTTDEADSPYQDAPWFDQFKGVARVDGGLVLIQDLEKFLSDLDARALAQALEAAH